MDYNNILLESFLNQAFEFQATSYEIYAYGVCIERDTCRTFVKAEFSIYLGMIFWLKNNPTYIKDCFSVKTAHDDLLQDRVQYGRLHPTDYFSGVSSKPIVCNIFPKDGILRFATPNPLQLVEFSGTFKLCN